MTAARRGETRFSESRRMSFERKAFICSAEVKSGRSPDYNVGHPSFLEKIELNLRRGHLRPFLPLELTFPKSEFAVRPEEGHRVSTLTVATSCGLFNYLA
jgi:hypothetical protein